MSATSAFSDLITSITERGRSLIGLRTTLSEGLPQAAGLIERCEALLSGQGEASGTALAAEVLTRYAALEEEDRILVFQALLHRFGPDQDRLVRVAMAWLTERSDAIAGEPHFPASRDGRSCRAG